jgi:hypothetical protein
VRAERLLEPRTAFRKLKIEIAVNLKVSVVV